MAQETPNHSLTKGFMPQGIHDPVSKKKTETHAPLPNPHGGMWWVAKENSMKAEKRKRSFSIRADFPRRCHLKPRVEGHPEHRSAQTATPSKWKSLNQDLEVWKRRSCCGTARCLLGWSKRFTWLQCGRWNQKGRSAPKQEDLNGRLRDWNLALYIQRAAASHYSSYYIIKLLNSKSFLKQARIKTNISELVL